MPWLCNCDNVFLTTYDGVSHYWFGSLVQEKDTAGYGVGPLVHGFGPTKTLYYWMRENRTGE